MRLAVAIIILTIFGCALLASHQHKPFPLLVDEAKANTLGRPNVVVCKVIIFGPARKRIVKV